jgi:ParB-like chromosome segregation protein Spo0J
VSAGTEPLADRIHPALEELGVPIDSVNPYPGNPRKGDVGMIAESLRVNGQYRPIVVNERTSQILAGNHTWRAAKSRAWERIAATFVDVDDQTAARIVAVDNRAGDLAAYDDVALIDLLDSLPDLEGTGYSDADLERLKAQLEDETGGGGGGKTDNQTGMVRLAVGPVQWYLPETVFEEWAEATRDRWWEQKVIIAEIRRLLGLVRATPTPKTKAVRQLKRSAHVAKVTPAEPEQRHMTIADLQVPIGSLVPYPGNPRQGDVGAIAESLRINGQTRPIVANSKTLEILAGNHTWLAAKALGWAQVAAVFVDVDEEAERRIVAVDNRTADVGGYDNEALVRLLQSIDDLQGSGYDGDDLDELLAGLSMFHPEKPERSTTTTTVIGVWSFPSVKEKFDDWLSGVRDQVGPSTHAVAAEVQRRLGFDAEAADAIVEPE